MRSFLLLHGPNLNLLGTREPDIYGSETLSQIEEELIAYGESLEVSLRCFQSNHEGVLIDTIHNARKKYLGIIYNPGAHAHYSYALRDAIASIDIPVVEVHLSDIENREAFRKISVMSDVCIAHIKGKGKAGYKEALDVLLGKTHQ